MGIEMLRIDLNTLYILSEVVGVRFSHWRCVPTSCQAIKSLQATTGTSVLGRADNTRGVKVDKFLVI
jgi:hypothetical protein